MDATRYIGAINTNAKSIIKRAQEALNSARKFLESEKRTDLENAIERSEKFDQQSKQVSDMAREARTLAVELPKSKNNMLILQQYMRLDEMKQKVLDAENLLNAGKKQLQDEKVKTFLKKAGNLDGTVGTKLNELHKRLEVRKTLGVIAGKMDDARYIGGFGEINIVDAESIIKRAQEALNSARKFLESEELTDLENAVERSEKFGQQSKQVSEMAREARTRADKLLDVDNMLEQVKKLAEEAKKAIKAYDDALDLYYEENSINLPDFDVEKMEDIIEQTTKIQEQAAILAAKHKKLLDKMKQKSEDAEVLLNAGKKQQQTTKVQEQPANLTAEHGELLDKMKQKSEDAEDLLNAGKKQQKDEKVKTFLKQAGKVALITAGGSAAILGGIAVAVPALGFTSAGVAAGSLAAGYQSAFLGGTIASGSAFAVLQSVGAAGLAASTQAGIVGATALSTVAGVFGWKEKTKEKENEDLKKTSDLSKKERSKEKK